MSLAKTVGQIPAIILGVVLAMIFGGLGVYILSQMGTTASITILTNLSNSLGTWANTWFPIILLVSAAAIIILLLVKGFGGGR
ncbi:MAG: hypothetical protein QW303_03910 [Nitrososphaerota archaeon]